MAPHTEPNRKHNAKTALAVVSGLSLQLMLTALLSLAASGFSSGALAQGTQSGDIPIDDSNATSAAYIRSQYFKRYPFAKKADDADQVNKGESQEGGSSSVHAYTSLTRYCKDDNSGCVNGMHIHYKQEDKTSNVTTPTARDSEALDTSSGWIKSYGLPCSDTQFQIIDRECRQRFLELLYDPQRWMWIRTAVTHIQGSSMANSVAGAAESSFQTAYSEIDQSLPNIANENTTGGQSNTGQAIYLVQQMYKQCFVPMALLLLLPGAVMTQLRGLVNFGVLGGSEDANTPIDGILRAMIAVLLIPATQLIVSYAIDVGNTMAAAVRDPDRQWIQEQKIMDWAKAQTYNPSMQNANNGLVPPSGGGNGNSQQSGGNSQGGGGGDSGGGGGNSSSSSSGGILGALLDFFFGPSVLQGDGGAGGQGKELGQDESQVHQENQLFLSGIMALGFNSASYLFSTALTVLSGFQLVFMCYLFLLGPIAAAFFAWPATINSGSSSKKLFKDVFANWLNAVIVLALWRFYWCVILAVMTQRLIQMHVDKNSPIEMMVFNCFLALLLYIPFQPFSFAPGAIVSQMLDKASEGGGGGGGGGANPAAASQATGNNAAHGSSNQPGNTQVSHSAAPSNSQTNPSARDQATGHSGSASDHSSNSGHNDGGSGNSGSADGNSTGTPPNSANALVSPPPSAAPANSGASQPAVATTPPPTANSASNANINSGNGTVENLKPGQRPIVPLAPSADRSASNPNYMVATQDQGMAQAGMQAWQQTAAMTGNDNGGNQSGNSEGAGIAPVVQPMSLAGRA